MRFGSYLRSVDALVTAGALCSPILGTFKRDDLAADVVGAVDWETLSKFEQDARKIAGANESLVRNGDLWAQGVTTASTKKKGQA